LFSFFIPLLLLIVYEIFLLPFLLYLSFAYSPFTPLSYSYSYFRYYHPDAKKAETAMRPSSTLNAIIDGHLQANTIAK